MKSFQKLLWWGFTHLVMTGGTENTLATGERQSQSQPSFSLLKPQHVKQHHLLHQRHHGSLSWNGISKQDQNWIWLIKIIWQLLISRITDWLSFINSQGLSCARQLRWVLFEQNAQQNSQQRFIRGLHRCLQLSWHFKCVLRYNNS